jgi:Fe-S cluster assembly ATP-binding protein
MNEYISKLACGDVIPAKVTHLEPFGCFADIGCGIVSLIPIDAISVSRISHPGDRFFNGQDITGLGISERAGLGIAYAFQQPVRFKGIRVLDLIRIAAGKTLSVSDACQYLSSVGLCARDYVDREVNASLSGGELKRIEIATVLARHAKLSVFDEPEAGIDLWSFRNLIDVFRNMRVEIADSSILVISHQERILNIADEIVVIKDGRVEKHGTREEIYPSLGADSAEAPACDRLMEKMRGEEDA